MLYTSKAVQFRHEYAKSKKQRTEDQTLNLPTDDKTHNPGTILFGFNETVIYFIETYISTFSIEKLILMEFCNSV